MNIHVYITAAGLEDFKNLSKAIAYSNPQPNRFLLVVDITTVHVENKGTGTVAIQRYPVSKAALLEPNE